MTSRPAKLLFDENVPILLVTKLTAFVEQNRELKADIKHLSQLFHGGKKDEDWVPQILQGGWTVISGDTGKGRFKKGQPLPHLCRQFSVTLIMLSRRVHERKCHEKLLTVLSVLPQLLEIATQATATFWQLTPGLVAPPNIAGRLKPVNFADR